MQQINLLIPLFFHIPHFMSKKICLNCEHTVNHVKKVSRHIWGIEMQSLSDYRGILYFDLKLYVRRNKGADPKSGLRRALPFLPHFCLNYASIICLKTPDTGVFRT